MGLVRGLIALGKEMVAYPPYRNPLFSVVMDDGLPIDEGPDDLWPADTYAEGRMRADVVENKRSDPELVVNQQWGIKLPNGEIHWVQWGQLPMGHPIERVRLIANLQKIAEDIGLPSGEQTDEFLSHYEWVTRNQLASVVYENTGVYPLTHPEVSALDTPSSGDPNESHNASPAAPGRDHSRGIHQGSVGGDAQ